MRNKRPVWVGEVASTGQVIKDLYMLGFVLWILS